MKRINRPCPVCDELLFTMPHTPGETYVYCGYGPCPSHVTNDGGLGATEKEAYDVLCRKVEEELMQNEPD